MGYVASALGLPKEYWMRFLLRLLLLALVSTLVVFSAVGVASAGDWGRVSAAKHGNGQAAAAQNDVQGAASQGGGQGASTNHGGCVILDPSATGLGNVVVNPNGTNYTCHGELPAGVSAPDRPVKVDDGDCTSLLTPSGKAKTSCHSKNP
jgi:hypothetical protein